MLTSHPSFSSEHDPMLQPNVSSDFLSVPRGSLFPCPLSLHRECQGQGLQQNLSSFSPDAISSCRRWVEQVIYLLLQPALCSQGAALDFVGEEHIFPLQPSVSLPSAWRTKRAAVPCVHVLFSSLLTLGWRRERCSCTNGGTVPCWGPVKCRWKLLGLRSPHELFCPSSRTSFPGVFAYAAFIPCQSRVYH